MNLNNKVAVVTGGASGLGRATAEAFVSAGAKVAIFDLDEDKGKSLSESLGKAAIFCEVNIADDAMIEAGVDRVMQVFGAIHTDVNGAECLHHPIHSGLDHRVVRDIDLAENCCLAERFGQ